MRAGRHARRRPPLPQRAAGRGVRHRGGAGARHRHARVRDPVAGRASLPARGVRVHPEHPDARGGPGPPHRAREDRLRLQRRPHVASPPPRRGLRGRGHPHQGTCRVRGGARVSHPRGRDLRQPDAGRRGQPRALRGAGGGHPQGLPRGVVLAPGQALHAPAGGPLPRLPAEGDHAGAASPAPARRGVAAHRERQRAGPGVHGPPPHQGGHLRHRRGARPALGPRLPGDRAAPRPRRSSSARS